MLKAMIRITVLPVLFLVRLALGSAAFVVTIASAIVGLSTSVFALLGVIECCIGYWQNGIAFFALALLASPIGLPMIAYWILNRLGNVCAFLEGLLC